MTRRVLITFYYFFYIFNSWSFFKCCCYDFSSFFFRMRTVWDVYSHQVLFSIFFFEWLYACHRSRMVLFYSVLVFYVYNGLMNLYTASCWGHYITLKNAYFYSKLQHFFLFFLEFWLESPFFRQMYEYAADQLRGYYYLKNHFCEVQ